MKILKEVRVNQEEINLEIRRIFKEKYDFDPVKDQPLIPNITIADPMSVRGTVDVHEHWKSRLDEIRDSIDKSKYTQVNEYIYMSSVQTEAGLAHVIANLDGTNIRTIHNSPGLVFEEKYINDWKPSEKQMQALSDAGNSFRPFEEGHKILWSLYNDLKKLM